MFCFLYFMNSTGLKLLYLSTRPHEESITSQSSGEGDHVVQIHFPLAELVVSEKTIEKLSFQARLTLALSLMGSVMAVMSIFKMVVEKLIDTYHLGHKEVPQDVQRRHVVLSESMITFGGSRRMSSFVKTKRSLRPQTMTNPLYVPRKKKDIDGDVELQKVVSRSGSSFKTYASMRKMVQELQMEMKAQQMEMKAQLQRNQQRDVEMEELKKKIK